MKLGRLTDLLKFYYAQRVTGFSVSPEPHFDPDSTAPFVERLGRSKSYVEYGAGGSTMLAARLGIPTFTVDSDPYFARAVEKALPSDADVTLRYVDIGLTERWGKPVFKRLTPQRVERWARYVRAPFDGQGDRALPDLVLVDGRFRVACGLAAADQANRAGCAMTICIDDYVGREYATIETYLGQPTLHGRMAYFEVDGSKSIPADVLAEAMRDWR